MLIFENISLALAGLKANKVRTFLTMLGIVIGIASVIAIMTVSDSMNNSIMSSMGDMGANNISVYLTQKGAELDEYGYAEKNDSIREVKTKDYFTEDMLEALETKFGAEIKGVSLNKNIGDAKAEDGEKTADVTLVGTNSVYLSGKKLKLAAGRTLTASDYNEGKKVAVVSDKVIQKMYGGDAESALGSSFQVIKGKKYYSYTIVGVYQHIQSNDAFMGGSFMGDTKTDCYLPLDTAMMQEKQKNSFETFEIVTKGTIGAAELAQSIANFLNERYYTNNDAYEAYAYSMTAMIGEMESMLNTQKLAFAAIGAISLLVGGIGVMNIMIVSITERTREIGTRKALGATNGSIRLQFIMEAVVICLIGGIIGVILGLGLGLAVSNMMNYPGVPSMRGIIFCVLFSAAFGIFFGYYPANKAAKLNPIEALRYE